MSTTVPDLLAALQKAVDDAKAARVSRVENHWCLDCASHTCEHAHASYDDRDPARCGCRGCAGPTAEEAHDA